VRCHLLVSLSSMAMGTKKSKDASDSSIVNDKKH
jgi:hypothetical protein